jgi:hypothetical protein
VPHECGGREDVAAAQQAEQAALIANGSVQTWLWTLRSVSSGLNISDGSGGWVKFGLIMTVPPSLIRSIRPSYSSARIAAMVLS